jgi:D-glycerate 3-kinase
MTAGGLTADIEALMAAEALPPSFHAAVEQIYAPLAARVAERFRRSGRPRVVGLCGPQGGGKSTGAAVLGLLLQAQGLRVARLSLDDLYLTRAERRRLAAEIHPLLAVRGPPGTHDLGLGEALIDRLSHDRRVAMPMFDKASDDRRPADQWAVFEGPADMVLFEGWCVGARPQPPADLVRPVNDLERDLDPDGVWRRFVNDALGRYQPLFARIDFQILLQPPGFEVVARWRREQEAKLRGRTVTGRPGVGVMTDAEVDRFVQHYERLTRHIIREMPARADALVELGPERELRRLVLREAGGAEGAD